MTGQSILSETLARIYSLTPAIFGIIIAYGISRAVYLIYFHQLSSFPGPRIAAVSNIWYAYHWLFGRYPWAVEDALRKYGPVVRIAPNELAFMTPQAFSDIYSPHRKNMEIFVKSDFQNRGKNLGGLIWEEDPVRHREVARQLAPAFSSRHIRTMEPLVHQYIDYFLKRMDDVGSDSRGVKLAEWTNWLAMDMSADLAWNEKMHQMRDMKSSVHLDALLSFNLFATVLQVFKRFPLLTPFQYFFAPIGKLSVYSAMEKVTRESVLKRIDRRGRTEHPDFFDYILPADSPFPTDAAEQLHIGSLALQMMFAGWGPMGDLFYGIFVLLLQEPECYKLLADEIRSSFATYDDITSNSVASLPYLHACLQEALRVLPSNHTGLPRISPGATVDGTYIPQGTYVQTCIWALARSPAYFHDALRYRPQRWLPADHPLYDPVFCQDNIKGLYPFSLGPRVCLGRELAWIQGKLFVAKVLFKFDVVRVPGQHFDLERTLLHYGFFQKPELRVQFMPVDREGSRGKVVICEQGPKCSITSLQSYHDDSPLF